MSLHLSSKKLITVADIAVTFVQFKLLLSLLEKLCVNVIN